MAEGNGIAEIFDTREDGLKCVRFESGDIGVVDKHGKVILQYGKFRHAEFADHDFVKLRSSMVEVLQNPALRNMLRDENCSCRHIFYVDLKSGQMYGSMPELRRYGNFEVAFLRDYIFTRTNRCYGVEYLPTLVWPAHNGLYLILPYIGTLEKDVLNRMLDKLHTCQRCLIKGDDAQVYWLIVQFDDESVVVMDEEGVYYYVRLDRNTGKAVWRELGNGGNIAERSLIHMTIKDIRVEVRERMKQDEEEAKKAAERQRRKEMKTLESAVPFQIGGKWGLKLDGRIIVPPIYRTIQAPVGKYCAMETYPGIWGVIAVDGKVEIEAKYEGVEIRPDGTVELMLYGGKTVIKKLKG